MGNVAGVTGLKVVQAGEKAKNSNSVILALSSASSIFLLIVFGRYTSCISALFTSLEIRIDRLFVYVLFCKI